MMGLGCRQGLVVVLLWAGVPALLAQVAASPSAETQKHIDGVVAGLMPPVIVKGDAQLRTRCRSGWRQCMCRE